MHAMIIVLGRVTVRPDALPQAQALASQHVARSRAEPGCLAHGFSIDAENPLELVFVEKWQSLAHLQAHFAVPASRAFAKDLAGLAIAPPVMEVFEAAVVDPFGRRSPTP